MKYITIIAFVSLFSVFTAGCASLENTVADFNRTARNIDGPGSNLINHHRCPDVFVVEELSYVNQYRDTPGENTIGEDALVARTKLSKTSSGCTYENKSVTVDINLLFAGVLGKHGRLRSSDDPFFSYPFFVAITDRSGDILAKQLFAATLHYEKGKEVATYSETLRQIIPVESASQGDNYAVMAGFQLTEEQLVQNRAFIRALKTEKAAKAYMEATNNSEEIEIETDTQETNSTDNDNIDVDSLNASGPIKIYIPFND